jgi:magnesium-dependent phosphatase 1
MIKPKLIAFDLDGTVWSPDMYQLWGGGSPFSVRSAQSELQDRSGQSVRLLGIVGEILHSLRYAPEWEGVIVAWVSCTDEPSWANECLTKFVSTPTSRCEHQEPVRLKDLAHSSQIYKANKQVHMNNLHKEYPHIPLKDMIFFDNERHNTDNTSKIGVCSIHCEHGMTSEIWEKGLDIYDKLKR